jgi:glycosyltransferase involved in cell wall biosynthesis
MATGKRVLLVEPCYENYGGYYRAYGMARGLARAGYDVTLLISNRKRFAWRLERTTPAERLRIVKLPRTQFNPWLTGRVLRAVVALGFCLFGRYDLIHVFTIVQVESLLPFLFLRLLLPWKRVIVDWDDYWSFVHLCGAANYERFPFSLAPRYFRACEYGVQRLARHATCTSRLLEGELRRLGVPHRLKIVNGVDRTQFVPRARAASRAQLGLAEGELVLLTVGHTYYRERAIFLVKLFEAIWRLEPSARMFCTAGVVEGFHQFRTTETADPAALVRIRRVGLLYGDDLATYLAACDAVLFTMGEIPTEQACFPTRIGTYLHGERILAMNETDTEACHTVKELDCALVDRSIERLAERTVAVLRDPAARRAMEDRIRVAKEKLSWEALGEELARFYAETLAGR